MARLCGDLYRGGFGEELRHWCNDNFPQKTVQIADILKIWQAFLP